MKKITGGILKIFIEIVKKIRGLQSMLVISLGFILGLMGEPQVIFGYSEKQMLKRWLVFLAIDCTVDCVSVSLVSYPTY